jgi:hypothetical protein
MRPQFEIGLPKHFLPASRVHFADKTASQFAAPLPEFGSQVAVIGSCQ